MNHHAKTRLRTLELKADRLWQEAVMLKWNNRCAIFPTLPASCGHHIIKRGCKETRHELLNGIAVSVMVHDLFEKHPAMLLEWLRVNEPAMYTFHMEHRNPLIRVWYPDMVQAKIAVLQQSIREML